jgi:hypothetical protein
VLESRVLQYLDVAGDDWTALPSVHQLLVLIADLGQQAEFWEILPDDGVNLGRAMRCRMMSLLC